MHAFNHGRTVPTTATMQKVVGCCPARPGQIFDHHSTVKSLLDTGDATNTTARTDHGSITRAGCHRSSGVGHHSRGAEPPHQLCQKRRALPSPPLAELQVAGRTGHSSGEPYHVWHGVLDTPPTFCHPTPHPHVRAVDLFSFFLSITYPFWLARHILAMGGENRIALDKQVTIRVTDCNICSHKLAHKQDQPALTTNKSTRPPTMGVAFLQF